MSYDTILTATFPVFTKYQYVAPFGSRLRRLEKYHAK